MRDYGSEISALAAQLMAIMRDARQEIEQVDKVRAIEKAIEEMKTTPMIMWNPTVDPNYQNIIGLSAEQKHEIYKQQLSGPQSMTLSDLCDKSMREENPINFTIHDTVLHNEKIIEKIKQSSEGVENMVKKTCENCFNCDPLNCKMWHWTIVESFGCVDKNFMTCEDWEERLEPKKPEYQKEGCE